MVVPGTPRDSLYIRDALLSLGGGVKPERVTTDNASYFNMVFGLFKILGHNFVPQFRDLDDQRFWRATMPGVGTGTYGVAEALARNRVNPNKLITHWPDTLKVTGSRWARRSPSTGGSPRPSTCCGWSIRWTTPIGGR